MKNVITGQKFIETTLDNIELKEGLASNYYARYLLRAIITGIIVLFGYILYMALNANFKSIGVGEVTLQPIGMFLAASMFSLCLVIIYYTKSELLTSNMMITTVGKYYNKITYKTMFKILALCLAGNFLGGLIGSLLVANSSIVSPEMADIMEHSITVKQSYISDGHYIDLIVRAIFCNFFINIGMLVVYSGHAKSDFMKVLAMFFGVFMFMYLGLEHSVANTILFTFGICYDIVNNTNLVDLSLAVQNVFWVLIGNFIGGGLFVGLTYAFLNDTRKIDKESK